jgi:ADP-ribose pyrophosphatase
MSKSKYEFQTPSYPPKKEWDYRMVGDNLCPSLIPIQIVHENPWFTVNNRGGYFTTEMKEAQGVVLPIIEKKSIILVRVFRPVINDYTLELPAGGFSLKDEAPEKGLRRELAEETGIFIEDCARLEPLPPISVSPNRNPNLIFPFKVDISQDEFQDRKDHDNEVVEVLSMSFNQVVRLINSGEIYVALPIAVILRFLAQKELYK